MTPHAAPLPRQATVYQRETFTAFVFSLWPALLLILCNLRPLLACAAPNWNPLAVLGGVWALSILHDPWFWAVHATLHAFKPLYRRIHHQHHDHPWGDLTLHQTADMHFLEAFALTMGFYAACLIAALRLVGPPRRPRERWTSRGALAPGQQR